MDQSAAAGLASLSVNCYARYQVPKSARIPRKPVSPSLYTASITLNEETDDELTEARNPLAKIINILPQSTAGGRPCAQATIAGDGTSPIVHTHVLSPEDWRATFGRHVALLQRLFDLWTKEVLCLLISLGCIIGVVAVLHAADGTNLSRLPLAVTLNAFLALFTTFAVVALYIPVTEAISQWKWNWFISKHPLSDYEIIDGASRSVWGAALLLRHFSARHILCLGAAVQILNVFISPITQMMISYPQHLVASSDGKAVVAAVQVLQDVQRSPFEPWDLQAAIAAGLMHPLGSTIQPVAPSCTTTDCTFDTFESLAVCAKVNDITHRLDITAQNDTLATGELSSYVASLPPTANCKLDSPKAHAVIACKTLEEDTLSFNDTVLSRVAMYSMPVIYVDSQNSTGQRNATTSSFPSFGAFEVLFHFCVNSYDIEMLAGNVTTKTTEHQQVASKQETSHFGVNCSTPSTENAKSGCSWDKSTTTTTYLELSSPAGPGQVSSNGTMSFKAELRTTRTLISAMHTLTSGLWEWDGGNYVDDTEALSVRITGAAGVQAIAGAIHGPGATNPSSRLTRLSGLAQNVAVALTNGIRLKKQQTTADGAIANMREIQGKAFEMGTSISIKWGWLTLFVLQYLLAAGFFISTVSLTDRSGGQVVKSSALATMVALGDECGPELRGIDTLTVMRKRAKGMQVQRDGACLELAASPSGAKTAQSSNSHAEKMDVTVTEAKF